MEAIWTNTKLDPPNLGSKETHVITGGAHSLKRRPEDARLIRNDGAWMHFAITVREERGSVVTLAYHFEIVFPEGHQPWFLRFDLNEPGHANESRKMRSHFHPGNDDLMAPSADMEPLEVLQLMVYHLRPRNSEKPRS